MRPDRGTWTQTASTATFVAKPPPASFDAMRTMETASFFINRRPRRKEASRRRQKKVVQWKPLGMTGRRCPAWQMNHLAKPNPPRKPDVAISKASALMVFRVLVDGKTASGGSRHRAHYVSKFSMSEVIGWRDARQAAWTGPSPRAKGACRVAPLTVRRAAA